MLPETNDVRQALQALGDLDREIGGKLPAYPIEDVVGLGQRLWWLLKRGNKALEPIKIRLREEAIKQGKGAPGNHRFESPDGSHCIVTIPNPSPILRRDADMALLRDTLGEVFDECFDMVVSIKPKKDIEAVVARLPPDKASAVMSVLDLADTTPRVAFKD